MYAEYLKHYPEGELAKAEGANVNRIRISATAFYNEQKRQANLHYGKVVDEQGNAYRSIRLGKQTWLADNLKLWLRDEATCFMNDPRYCQRFGKLYTWAGAQEACQRLGAGWRLPSLADWEKMCLLFDPEGNLDKGSFKVFSALLKGGKSGFETRGAGYFTPDGGFMGVYYDAGFWTSTPLNPVEAYEIVFLGREKRAYKAIAEQNYRLSCRCVRDEEDED